MEADWRPPIKDSRGGKPREGVWQITPKADGARCLATAGRKRQKTAGVQQHRTAAHWPNPFRYAGFVARSLGSRFTLPAKSRAKL